MLHKSCWIHYLIRLCFIWLNWESKNHCTIDGLIERKIDFIRLAAEGRDLFSSQKSRYACSPVNLDKRGNFFGSIDDSDRELERCSNTGHSSWRGLHLQRLWSFLLHMQLINLRLSYVRRLWLPYLRKQQTGFVCNGKSLSWASEAWYKVTSYPIFWLRLY